MFDYLENHNFFVSKKAFDNTRGYQNGFEKILYTEYEFENEEVGDNLFVFVPEKEGEVQWIYHFPKLSFMQKFDYKNEYIPNWTNKIVQEIEEKYLSINNF